MKSYVLFKQNNGFESVCLRKSSFALVKHSFSMKTCKTIVLYNKKTKKAYTATKKNKEHQRKTNTVSGLTKDATQKTQLHS